MTLRPFMSLVALAISSPTFLGDYSSQDGSGDENQIGRRQREKMNIPDRGDQSWGQGKNLLAPHLRQHGGRLKEQFKAWVSEVAQQELCI